ncbi:MAG TPA: hypothetical protein VF329_06020 [Gammaproteobacteria bacterium]
MSCRHLSRLDLDAVRGERERLVRYGPVIEEFRRRGLEHERRYLEHLRAQGRSVTELTNGGIDEARSSLETAHSRFRSNGVSRPRREEGNR